MEELSLGELVWAVLAHQGVAMCEEVVEDKETGVVSTVEVLDLMEEDERGSFGDLTSLPRSNTIAHFLLFVL